jgi:hypothetical protein
MVAKKIGSANSMRNMIRVIRIHAMPIGQLLR